jgi:hypothetical protein
VAHRVDGFNPVAERGEVSEEAVRDLLGPAEIGDGVLKVARIPQDDCGDLDVQAQSTVLLVLVGAVADLAEAMDEDGTRLRPRLP